MSPVNSIAGQRKLDPATGAALTLVTSIIGVSEKYSISGTDITMFGLNSICIILLVLFSAGTIQLINSDGRLALFLKLVIPVSAFILAPLGASAYSKIKFKADFFSTPKISSSIGQALPTYYIEDQRTNGTMWVRSNG